MQIPGNRRAGRFYRVAPSRVATFFRLRTSEFVTDDRKYRQYRELFLSQGNGKCDALAELWKEKSR